MSVIAVQGVSESSFLVGFTNLYIIFTAEKGATLVYDYAGKTLLLYLYRKKARRGHQLQLDLKEQHRYEFRIGFVFRAIAFTVHRSVIPDNSGLS